MSDGDLARDKAVLFLAAVDGAAVVDADPRMARGSTARLAVEPRSPGLRDRIWWGSGTRASAAWVAGQGMSLMSSTLLTEDTGVPFDELQAEQIALFRQVWKESGWQREPRVSVSRSVMPIVNDLDEAYFGRDRDSTDQVGSLGEPGLARFGKTYAGDPDVVAEQLSKDAAVREADTLLLTIPSALGVDYNTHLMRSIVEHVAPALGWKPSA